MHPLVLWNTLLPLHKCHVLVRRLMMREHGGGIPAASYSYKFIETEEVDASGVQRRFRANPLIS